MIVLRGGKLAIAWSFDAAMINGATARFTSAAQGESKTLTSANRSTKIEEAVVPKVRCCVSGHKFESRSEAGLALASNVKAFEVPARLAGSGRGETYVGVTSSNQRHDKWVVDSKTPQEVNFRVLL
jgi:hypothetical protein